MKSNNQEKRNRNNSTRRSFTSAFDRTTHSLNYIAVPVTIVSFFKDWKEVMAFVAQNSLLAFFFLIAFLIIFLRFVVCELEIKLPVYKREIKSADDHEEKRGASKTFFQKAALLFTFFALGIVLFISITVYITGVHFVIVESSDEKQRAISRASEMNKLFKDAGEKDLVVTVNDPVGDNPYFALTIGGPHFSRKSAEETLSRARQVLGKNIRSDAWIQSHSINSLIKKSFL